MTCTWRHLLCKYRKPNLIPGNSYKWKERINSTKMPSDLQTDTVSNIWHFKNTQRHTHIHRERERVNERENLPYKLHIIIFIFVLFHLFLFHKMHPACSLSPSNLYKSPNLPFPRLHFSSSISLQKRGGLPVI